jgi:hypothetical protein
MGKILISSDKYYGNNTPGYSYTANGDMVTITAGVLVGSVQGQGVVCDSVYSGATLSNSGNILSGSFYGVNFMGDNGRIENSKSGHVFGNYSGITAGGDVEVIINHGKVFGLGGAGIMMSGGSNHVSVSNDGEIYGLHRGIGAFSDYEGGTINNIGAGVIRSDHDGIDVHTKLGLTTLIKNGANATISGADYSVHTKDAGGIWLVNDGKLVGNLRCDAPKEHDTIINRGTITGNVVLGSGDDRYNGLGGGAVTGNIQGGLGNDTFEAGMTREIFYGQAGADTFDFRSASFSPAGAARDFVKDFSHVQGDKLDLHFIDASTTQAGNQAFTFIGTDTFAHCHSLHPNAVGMVRFDAGLHRLQANVNRNFATAEFEVALPGVASLVASDFVL